MRPKTYISILVFLVLVVGVLAVQPQIAVPTSTNNAIEIIYPKTDCLKMGMASQFPFDVLNANFSKLTNETTTCKWYIADQEGQLEGYGTPIFNSTTRFWSFEIPDSIIDPGDYSFYIYCNKSLTENGFVSLTYQMTKMGICASDDKSPLAAIILVPLIFGIMIMIASFVLDDDHKVLKIILFMLSYITVFISLWFGMSTLGRYYGFFDMQTSIGTVTWILGIVLFVIMSYFIIYAFIMSIQTAAQKKREKLGW